jgi:hypothetical protein
MQAKYAIYATLLDAFAWYKKSEADGALEEFLGKVNRVPFEKTDAILRGMAFETLVDDALKMGIPEGLPDLRVHDVKCSVEILRTFTERLQGSVRQVYVESILDTRFGPVKVYGKVDEILRDTAFDIKTTGKYEFPKYLRNWQHPVYLEALQREGVTRFVYLATDFREVYEEEYTYNSADTDRLISEVSHLVETLEAQRDRITDRKVFCLPELGVAAY